MEQISANPTMPKSAETLASARSIYRFKLSPQFEKLLLEFVRVHKLDEVQAFRDAWNLWVETSPTAVSEETRRLEGLGYQGDVLKKMYKSVRYYHKNKSDERPKRRQRRRYVSTARVVLDSIEQHIRSFGLRQRKPEEAFKDFMRDESRNELRREEKARLIAVGMDGTDAEQKLKKTYKNRFFVLQRATWQAVENEG